MRTLFTLFGVLGAISFGFAFPSDVYACSGGGSDNIQYLLERTDYVIKADVIAVDDVRQNAVLSVDSYLFGGPGPEYLLFLQADPVIVTRMTEGDPYGACNFFQPELHPGLSAYFFLKHRADGVYLSATQWNDPNYYAFPDLDTTVTFYSQGEESYIDHVLTEDDFVSFITEFGASTVTAPASSFSFPRLAPLQITTDMGTQYFLPVDSSIPIEVTPEFLDAMTVAVMSYDSTDWNEGYFYEFICPGEGCIQVSPDGINRAEQHSDEIIWFGGSASGRAFQFSSTGDAIAIWHEAQIEFYTLGWQKRDQPFREVTLLNSVTLAGEMDNPPYQAAWSPDGRIFSYSDAEGLWAIDVYNPSSEPVHLLATEDDVIPLALAYSPLGRYLQIQHGIERYMFDTISNEFYPDGLVSPDDQILLAFDTQADEFEPQICYLAPDRECQSLSTRILQISDDEARVFTRYTQAQWRNGYSFFVTTCERNLPIDCIVSRIENQGYSGFWYAGGPFWSEGFTFDYMAVGDVLVIVQNGFTLLINDEEIDFSSFIDSEITSVEWLPSLFYEAANR